MDALKDVICGKDLQKSLTAFKDWVELRNGKVESAVNELTEQVDELSGTIETLPSEVSQLTDKVDELNESVDEINSTIETLPSDVSQLTKQVNDLTKKVDGLPPIEPCECEEVNTVELQAMLSDLFSEVTPSKPENQDESVDAVTGDVELGVAIPDNFNYATDEVGFFVYSTEADANNMVRETILPVLVENQDTEEQQVKLQYQTYNSEFWYRSYLKTLFNGNWWTSVSDVKYVQKESLPKVVGNLDFDTDYRTSSIIVVKNLDTRAVYGCADKPSWDIMKEQIKSGELGTRLELTFGNDQTATQTIEKQLFMGCTNLVNLYLSGSVPTIEEEAFKDTTALEELTMEYDVSYKYDYEYNNGEGNLYRLGNRAFENSGVKKLDFQFEYGNSRYLVKEFDEETSPFKGCRPVEVIYGRNLIKNRGFINGIDGSSIEKATYYTDSMLRAESQDNLRINTPSLKELTVIGDTVPARATGSSTNLESVTLSGTEYVMAYGLSGITDSTNITGLENINWFAAHAFEYCSLKKISLPLVEENYMYPDDSVENAFAYSSVEEADLPKLKTVGENMFYWCQELTKINIPEATTIKYGAFCKCGFEEIDLPNVIEIQDEAFHYCMKLSNISLPKVTTIGSNSFADCLAITSLELPSCLETVSEKAFQGCTGLTKIDIHKPAGSLDTTNWGLPEGCQINWLG